MGLNNLENPQDGGWGGRLVQSTVTPSRWEDGDAATDYNPFTKQMDKAFAQIRWIPAIQEDFAARADWCVKDFKDANHAPLISVKGGNKQMVKPGQKITLTASASDPDKNKVALTFWQYKEVGTFKEKVIITPINDTNASIEIPKSANSGEVIHIIVEGKDDGVPSLTRYQRVVLKVK